MAKAPFRMIGAFWCKFWCILKINDKDKTIAYNGSIMRINDKSICETIIKEAKNSFCVNHLQTFLCFANFCPQIYDDLFIPLFSGGIYMVD